MTSSLTDPELRAAEEAWAAKYPDAEALRAKEWRDGWAMPKYSAGDLCGAFLDGYAAALRASPMGETANVNG